MDIRGDICDPPMKEDTMMKRLTLVLLTLLLCLTCSLALADDWGTLTINGQDADRVHLRGSPSTDAPSLGLYFTGTEVECLSDPSLPWVQVNIGAETGYVKGEYLTSGAVSAFPIGVVNADYVNFREAPSTQSEAIGWLHDGTAVILYGETVDGWYYAAHGMTRGYIKAEYVTMGEPVATSTPSAGNVTVTMALEDSVMAYVRAAGCLVYVHATDDAFIIVTYDPTLLTLDASTARGTNILFFESATGTPMLDGSMAAHVYLPKAYYHSVDLDVSEGIGYLNGAVDADFTIYASQGEVNLDLPANYAHTVLTSLSRSTMSVSLSESLTDYSIRFAEVTGSVIDVSKLYGVPPYQPGETHYEYNLSETSQPRLVFDIVRDATVEFDIIADRFTANP